MGQTDLIKQITNKQALFGIFGATVLLLAMFISNFVSAATLVERSITPSTASVSATADSVSYRVQFEPVANAGAFVIDFCSNTPLLGQSCTAPSGMDVADAATATSGVAITGATANKIVATKTMTASTPEDITITTLTNPDTVGVVYARIVTYATGAEATNYTSANPTNTGASTIIDSGSVSMIFNESVTVSGTVLETMTFCVSSAIINPGCQGVSAPVITLGEETAPSSGIFALEPGTVSTGTMHTQMNTNADGGAVVRLRSSATCGGLMRSGSNTCDIAAAMDDDVIGTDNSAKFGVKTAAATTAPGASNPIGTFQAAVGSIYDNTEFSFNWDDNDVTGVTSPFGDPFLDTNDAPATDQNMALTFGASVGTNTPAGTYSTDLNLIAVGKF